MTAKPASAPPADALPEVRAWIEARREHRRLVAIYNARVQYARDQVFGSVSCDHEYQAMCQQQRVLRDATEAAGNALEAIAASAQVRADESLTPPPHEWQPFTKPAAEPLCSDCPPQGYPTDITRCAPCPRRDTAAEPAPCVAADDTPSKSRAKRIRLEKGESVAVARWAMTTSGMRKQDKVGPYVYYADHARIVADLRDSVDVAQQEIDELRLHNSKQEASLAACRADAERLDALRDNSWDLRCFDMCGGEDIGWKVMEHHQAEPLEREVAIVFADDLRAAIDAARSQP